jgi:hypothetical protein
LSEKGEYMRSKYKLHAIVLMMLISISAIMAFGISNVSAQPPHPEIVIRPALITGVAAPVPPLYGYATYYVNIKNAPHTDADVDPWNIDKTWAWQVDLNWDPTVFGDPILNEDTYSIPGKSAALLGYFTYWTFTPVPYPHWVENPYPRSGLSTPPAPWGGSVTIFDGLKSAPDVTTLPIGAGDPNPGLHLGTNYDLPYSEGIDISGYNPTYYGPNELNLFMASFPILKDGPPYATPIWIDMTNTYFWCHDATTTYHVGAQTGWFGSTGPYLHSKTPVDPYNPVGSSWHELYPTYCDIYDVLEWEDNGNGILDYCDYLWMDDAMWYHVEDVTLTLWLDSKGPEDSMYIDYDCCEDEIPPYDPVPWPDAIGTQWHEIYPVFCNRYQITDVVDNGDGVLSVSDQITLVDKDTGVITEWHIVEMDIDIIVTPQPDKPPPAPEFPLGIGLMIIMALAIPTAYVWRLRRKETKQ